jgi:DNA-binding LacI/PurR family transcriptional regulator
MNNVMNKPLNTKANKVVNVIAREIAEGIYTPGTLLPTDRELATRYGVSPNTVRKSLDILGQKGTIVRQPQRGVVVTGSSHTETKVGKIAFITPMANPMANEFLEGLTDAVDYDHFMLATYVTNEDLEKYRKTVGYISQQRPSGVVVWVQAKEYCEVSWDCLAQAHIPVVGLGPHSIPNLLCDYVRDCVADAGTLVARHIIRRNFRDIAFLCTTSHRIQGERIEAIRREFAKVGLRLPDEKIFFIDAPHGYLLPPDPYLDAREFMTKLLRDGFRCECMICGHDYPAVGVLQALLKHGIRVPDEMKVISCGRSGVESISPMKLTTCFVDFSEQGRKAVQVLMRRMNGFKGPPEIHYTPVTLIEGETA